MSQKDNLFNKNFLMGRTRVFYQESTKHSLQHAGQRTIFYKGNQSRVKPS